MEGVLIEPMLPQDWEAVARIYGEGIASAHATFETEVPSWEAWDAGHLPGLRLIARCEEIVGWAALSPVSSRLVYEGVAEESVYVAADARGRGIGRSLLATLIERAEEAGIWTIQTSIFPENLASLELHLRVGFRVVGTRERIACHHGVWRDTMLLERRGS